MLKRAGNSRPGGTRLPSATSIAAESDRLLLAETPRIERLNHACDSPFSGNRITKYLLGWFDHDGRFISHNLYCSQKIRR